MIIKKNRKCKIQKKSQSYINQEIKKSNGMQWYATIQWNLLAAGTDEVHCKCISNKICSSESLNDNLLQKNK